MKSKLALVALPALVLGVSCRPKASADQAIRDTLSKAAQALEAGDAGGATAILDDRFQGPEGMNKAATGLFLVQVLRQGKVGVHLASQDIGITGDEAFERLHVNLTQQGSGVFPDGSRKVFILHWKLRGSEWKLVAVEDFTDRPEAQS